MSLFRERQIIIRSDEGVQYVRLSPLRQKLFAGVSFLSIAALSGWALSTSSVITDLQANGMAFVQSAYDRIAGHIAESAAESEDEQAEESIPEGTVIAQTET